MSREATSEQSSVCEGAGYDEVFQLGHEADEGFSWSSERGTSIRSPNDNAESYDREVEEKEESDGKDEGDDGAVDKDEGGVSKEGSSGSDGDGHTRPFILPKIWIVNDFMPTMTAKVFKDLWDRYQIPDHILICLPEKFEKWYSGKAANIDMYDAMFAAGLRLPLTSLHR